MSRNAQSRSPAGAVDRYGSLEEEEQAHEHIPLGDEELVSETPYLLQRNSVDEAEAGAAAAGEVDGLMRSARNKSDGRSYEYDDDDDDDSAASDYSEGATMSIQELLYSSSSYYAIAKPVTLTMILSALAVVYVNDAETRAEGQAAMANAYQVWNVDSSSGNTEQQLALSLANALVMVSVICAMTFVIVLLYRFRCMTCLLGYMMVCSCTLLGVLGGNLLQSAVHIYSIPVDKLTFFLFVFNFGIVGVISVFWGRGIPKYVTQGYLIATSVILAWHLSYFDEWTTWTLLFMLALYDLCAVLTPCGPLKALVELMSQDEAPEMPGLLFEADLPAEAKRPGIPKSATGLSETSRTAPRDQPSTPGTSSGASATGTATAAAASAEGGVQPTPSMDGKSLLGPTANIPLAIAKVYSLPVVSLPAQSQRIFFPQRHDNANVSASPLLEQDEIGTSSVNLPENPTPAQLRAIVTVRLPVHGGRIEQVSRRGKRVYLERDRHGEPKRILWVDRKGKVFAEMRGDDEEGPERNSIRLGLGDFIFYSVLVASAAQYSFATFAACTLVILAGLGGTLVLLSVYHHALPALPISIFLGVVFYLLTRGLIEPWLEVVMSAPFYV